MAEQSVDLPVASERAKSWEVELRRHSIGKASFGNNKENVISRYLRASTGSCHDFCKYGRNYAFEANEKHSISRRASLDSKLMKTSMVERRKSIDSKLRISCTSYTNKLELPTKSSDSKKEIGNEVLINRNKASLVKVKPSLTQKSHVSSIPKTFKVETQLKSTSNKKETPLKSTSGRPKAHSKATSMKMETSSKLSSIKVRAMELSGKPVISLNPNSVAMQTISSMDSSESFGGQRSTEIKMEKSYCKVVSPSRALLSSKSSHKRNARKHKSLKIVPCLKNQPKPRRVESEKHNGQVEEKTLYVINVENDNQTLQSDQNGSHDIDSSLSHSSSSHNFSSSIFHSICQEDQEESEYATSGLEEDSSSQKCETECIDNEESLEVEENGKPQKGETVFLEYKDCQMLKPKMVRENCETDIKVGADNIGDTTKVNLRHLEVEGKKDGQRLLNNVIEETTSKLVEYQKGKVKALVSAFESIISLQEKKAFANIFS